MPNVTVSVGLLPMVIVRVCPAVTAPCVSRLVGLVGPTAMPNSVMSEPVGTGQIDRRVGVGAGKREQSARRGRRDAGCGHRGGRVDRRQDRRDVVAHADGMLVPLIASVPPAEV